MKKIILALLALVAVTAAAYGQKKFSVLGDSYSTYAGYVTPEYNAIWYPNQPGSTDPNRNDVDSVNQTWWRVLCDTYGYELDTNNSYSGSTVSMSGYHGNDYSDRSFVTRVHNLGNPDIILIFGGTNDSWVPSPVGEYKFADFTKADLYAYRPALAWLLTQLKMLYPTARIYNILNSQLSDDIDASTMEICRYYGIPVIELHDIDKQLGHPSQVGMQAIAAQVAAALEAKQN